MKKQIVSKEGKIIFKFFILVESPKFYLAASSLPYKTDWLNNKMKQQS